MGSVVVDAPAEGVARVTIENAAKRNALDAEILEGLAATLPSLDARCVILTGAGSAFSAGYDIGNLTPERLADVLIHPFEAALAALDDVPVPVVADAQRARVRRRPGAGAGVRSARVRAGAKLGMPPARLGVVYSHTGLRRFVDAVGSARTRELFLTARPVGAERRWPGAWSTSGRGRRGASVALASEIAALAPLSQRGNKRVLRALIAPLDPALEAELEALRREAFASEDFAEGVRGFIEKRPPRWQGGNRAGLARKPSDPGRSFRATSLDRGSWMLDLEDRLDELDQLGRHQCMRMVSGPQGPRVVLDGRPVLLLCSGNALGLADHPKVRQAAADAAMRWGVGAGAARVSCGTMTLHRRLEERLAAFTGQRASLLFGSGALANMGVIGALARRGEVVLHDELAHASIVDGCRLSGAEVVAYRHADADHLAWALRQCDGRATLIATDGMFGMDGDVAPLREIVDLGHRYDVRVLVDEAHALGALGPDGSGAVAEAGLQGEVDVITGTLAKALGSYGGFVACDHVTARFLVHSARTLLHSTALPPVAAAAAMAALDLLEEQPRRVAKLRANAETLA